MIRLIARGALTFGIVLLAGFAVVLLVPRAMGGTTLAVLTGSMEPTIMAGDLIGVRGADHDNIALGEIVTYQPKSGDMALVTHRVVGLGSTGDGRKTLLTQGDANSAIDNTILAEQVMGQYLYRIPYLGYVFTVLAPYRMPLLGVLAVLILGAAFWPNKRRSKKQDSGDDDTRGPGAPVEPLHREADHPRIHQEPPVSTAPSRVPRHAFEAMPASRRASRWSRPAVAGVAALLLGLLSPAAAHATDSIIPGTASVTWNQTAVNLTTSDPNNSLIFGGIQLVPGDLWRRNGVATSNSPGDSWLVLNIANVSPGTVTSAIFQELEFAWSIDGFPAGSVTLPNAASGACSMIGVPVFVPAGSSAPIAFDLIFPLSSTGGNQGSVGLETVEFDLSFSVVSADQPRPSMTNACMAGTDQWLIDGKAVGVVDPNNIPPNNNNGGGGTGGGNGGGSGTGNGIGGQGSSPWDTLLSLTGGQAPLAALLAAALLLALGGASFLAYFLMYGKRRGKADEGEQQTLSP